MKKPILIPSRPVVRWHGGKWILAPWIISHFPEHRIYTEVYGGGGSVLMRKRRSYSEVYNDLDGEIVNLFKVLRDPALGNALADLLRLTPFAREEFNLAYEPVEEPLERARRMVVRSYMGFGSNAHNLKCKSGFRANSNRNGSTPAHDWANYPKALTATIERLKAIVIENREATEVLLAHDSEETLHYVDPPYPHSTRTDNKHDYSHELTDDDHRHLAAVLHGLNGMVVLSGYPCKLYDKELYPDWFRVMRSSLADGAAKRTEVLWLNHLAAGHLNGNLL